MCLTEHELFVLVLEEQDGPCHLFRAAMPSTTKELLASVSRMNLTEPVRPFGFRLASGVVLYIDRRLLAARSAYFSGRQDSEVDLSADDIANEASISASPLCIAWLSADSQIGYSHSQSQL